MSIAAVLEFLAWLWFAVRWGLLRALGSPCARWVSVPPLDVPRSADGTTYAPFIAVPERRAIAHPEKDDLEFEPENPITRNP